MKKYISPESVQLDLAIENAILAGSVIKSENDFDFDDTEMGGSESLSNSKDGYWE